MTTGESQSGALLTSVDRVLSDRNLLAEPRALLLLRICQVAQAFRPELLQRYWKPLRELSGSLPAEHREAFEGLRATAEPPAKASLGKFAQEIVAAADRGTKMAKTSRAEAGRILRDADARLRKRWWPFGKRPAWMALVQAWCEVDRTEALKLLDKIPRGVQQNTVARLNDVSPLTPDEWDLAHQHAGSYEGILPVLDEMLGRDNPVLRLSARLAEAEGARLLSEVHLKAPSDDAARKVEAQRNKALQRYLKLVKCVNEVSADVAESLMESLLTATATTNLYDETWPERFSLMRQLINVWFEFPAQRQKALSFLTQKTPKHLRDFCLAQWHACLPASPEEAAGAWQSLAKVCRDTAGSEAWFLVTLLRRGLGEVAMSMARSSPRAAELLPRIRRAWLLVNPETAVSAIAPQDLEGDLISQFLLLGTTRERVEFLRRRTENGQTAMPKEMWKRPDILTIAASLPDKDSAVGRASGDPAERALLSLYRKDQAPDRQFQDYMRMHGFGEYSHDEVDPHLLATLVAWDEEHGEEVNSLLSRMWNTMKPPTDLLRLDVLRNPIFERCQTLFAARPASLNELFIQWVKRTLVDNTVQEQVGDTIYTFSLKDIVPFLYCLLSAQKVAKLSAKRCDEILTCAIRYYTASEDLMTAAAELFASDKGLKAMQPPAPLKESWNLKAWQLGVVQVSLQEIVSALLAGRQEGKTTAVAA